MTHSINMVQLNDVKDIRLSPVGIVAEQNDDSSVRMETAWRSWQSAQTDRHANWKRLQYEHSFDMFSFPCRALSLDRLGIIRLDSNLIRHPVLMIIFLLLVLCYFIIGEIDEPQPAVQSRSTETTR